MSNPLPPPEEIRAKPVGIRFKIWIQFGIMIGLPVNDLLEAISTQAAAFRRERGKGPGPYTVAERLRLGELFSRMGSEVRCMLEWALSPDSIIRWCKRYQERQAQKRKRPEPAKPGRPPISQEKVDAILKIYRLGCQGAKRIKGELAKCGIKLAKSTIRRVLTDNGYPPAPDNGRRGSTWTTFLRLHASEILGIDYIQIATGWFGNITYKFVLVGIEHDTRKVHLLGVTEHPTDEWLGNVVRSATMDGEPLAKRRFWIHDNDGKFQTLPYHLENAGLESVPIVVRAPDMNAFTERYIRSMREECLDHIVFASEDHLRRVSAEYIEHYNTERPHQGVGNKPIGEWEAQTEGEIVCDERLSGLLKSFRRAA